MTLYEKIIKAYEGMLSLRRKFKLLPAPSVYSDMALRTVTSAPNVEYHRILAGAITDQLEAVTKNGAVATATISKVGGFDQIAVTGGNANKFLNYLTFDTRFVSDNQPIFKLSVKVDAISTDTNAPTWLGLGLGATGLTGDAGGNVQNIVTIDLTNKVAAYAAASSGSTTSMSSSAGTFAVAGDVLDLEMRIDIPNSVKTLRIINHTTGAWAVAKLSNQNIRQLFPMTGTLRLGITNGTFTILEYVVTASVPEKPLLATTGDAVGIGYDQISSTNFQAQLLQTYPYNFVSCNGNGRYIHTMAHRQMQDVLKLRPKYVLLFSILPCSTGEFRTAHANYSTFIASWNKHIEGAIASDIIPIVIKWPAGGSANSNQVDWATFLDEQVVLYPTLKVLDLRSFTFQYGDTFSVPSEADFTVMKDELMKLLTTLGL